MDPAMVKSTRSSGHLMLRGVVEVTVFMGILLWLGFKISD
jgi:hypothetical protein